MYLTRTSPMTRDRRVDAINTTVAENTECACDGRSSAKPRTHRERGEGWVVSDSVTGVDSTGPRHIAAKKEPASAIDASMLFKGGNACSGYSEG